VLALNIRHETKQISYSHKRVKQPPKQDFHLHDRFEVYLLISGDVHYFIEKKVYPLAYGDLLVMNNRELHKPNFHSEIPYENFVVHFDPGVTDLFSDLYGFDLLNCFKNRSPGERNKIHLKPHQLEEILALFQRMDAAASHSDDGTDLLITTGLVELLVLLNRAFRQNVSPLASSLVPQNLAPILDYIDRHLDHDLTLESLEQQFYMNKYYMSRLFRQSTGSTIHEYIMLKRITLAKKLLHEGYNVTDACQLSGFNDYSNFIRMFKRIVGFPPGQYRKQKWG